MSDVNSPDAQGRAPSASRVTEVLVAGGGAAGLTLSLALARRDIEVVLTEAGRREDTRDDGRAILVAAGCWRIFETLGLGSELAAFAEPVLEVEAQAPGGRIAFLADDLKATNVSTQDHAPEEGEGPAGDAPLGYMIEAKDLERVLSQAVDAEKRIVRLFSSPVTEIAFEEAYATCAAGGETIAARLLVGCDGARSRVREAAGIRFEGWAYDAKALSTVLMSPAAHEGRARQIFLKTGPIAALPMTGGRINLVWSVSSAVADALTGMSDQDFLAELAKQAPGFVPGARLAGPRFAFPVGLQVAERMHGPRVALAGDSAHRIHPLAGQGLNLGLKDVAALVDVICEAAYVGLDIGSEAALAPYTRWRRADVIAAAAAMEGFFRTFRAPAPVRALAGLAMGGAGAAPPLRRMFTQEAAAVSGDLPSLMRV
ncbi:MAG: FAD-dependent monooxygenase [Hyphomonadaceae bacterium]